MVTDSNSPTEEIPNPHQTYRGICRRTRYGNVFILRAVQPSPHHMATQKNANEDAGDGAGSRDSYGTKTMKPMGHGFDDDQQHHRTHQV